ncbi:MAG: hypothetical protein J5I92_16140 [Thiogranum sp.]|nr:hypothetical protein [Thiogranum sp.]
MDNILAIDQGTHASRALVLDSSGRVLAQRQHPVSLSRPQPGRAEQDGNELLASVQCCVTDVLGDLATPQRDAVRCCGITTQRSTVLAWQRDGTPVAAAINWQDTRGAPQLQALQDRADAVQRLSGLPLSPHYGATKLHFLHQLYPDPDLHLGPLAAFLVYRLSDGNALAADHTNAQRMQLLDIHAREWSRTLCDWFGVPLQSLPPCRPVCADYGGLDNSDIAITAVCGDQNAAWFGSGAPENDCVLVNLGSGAFLMARQDHAAAIPGLLSSLVYSDAAHSDYVTEGTVNGAGNALQWLQNEYGVTDIESHLAHWLQEIDEPPLFLNTVGGLGSPWWREGLAPRFAGDCEHLGHAALAAGVAESIVFLLQFNLERVQQRQPVRRLRVSGGLSRVDPLCQKLANLSDCPVQRSDHREASARGVAWLAAGRPGDWSTQSAAQHFTPRADKPLQARYRRFIEQLREYIESHDHA